MPRTSRNTVEFTVENEHGTPETWIAKFYHKHDTITEPLIVDSKRVQHLTTCYLAKKHDDKSILLRGEATCSIFAVYKWQRLVKQSFMAALAKASVTRKKNRTLFGRAMNAFFTELPVKSYWPHAAVDVVDVQPIVDGVIIDKRIVPTAEAIVAKVAHRSLQQVRGKILQPVGAIPHENQHGLGYSGA